MGTRFVEKKNLYWIVRDGSRINPFEDQWIPTTRNEIVGRNVGSVFSSFSVSHLIDHSTRTLRESLIHTLFPSNMVKHIQSIHLSREKKADWVVWKYCKDGRYSIKSDYFMAMGRGVSEVHGIGVRCWCWKKLWNLHIPAKWALFLWKLIHRILPANVVLIRI